MFRLGRTQRRGVAVCLKFSCTARDVLRSGNSEFYNTDIQRLTHRWQKYVENDGNLWKNSVKIAKYELSM
jgi:hypothetical protein